MTDKQIIIDGVDVSGCEYCSRYADTTIYNCDWIGECKEHPNCYYKQLKAKEQELIDYKKQFKADTKEMEDYQNEITRHLESIEYWQHQAEAKEQECEELKETFDGLFKVQYKLADNNKKLRQCLTEIKEIIHFNKTNRLSGGAYISIEQILQKISEVEDG